MRLAIAAVPYRLPEAVLDAVLAQPVFAVEVNAWAVQPEIVQRLHHRNAGFLASPINRWRNHHERIMDMNKIRLAVLQKVGDI